MNRATSVIYGSTGSSVGLLDTRKICHTITTYCLKLRSLCFARYVIDEHLYNKSEIFEQSNMNMNKMQQTSTVSLKGRYTVPYMCLYICLKEKAIKMIFLSAKNISIF